MRLTVRPHERGNPSPLARPSSAATPPGDANATAAAHHHHPHGPPLHFAPRHSLPHSPLAASHVPTIRSSLSSPLAPRSPPATQPRPSDNASILTPQQPPPQFFPASANGVLQDALFHPHPTPSHSIPTTTAPPPVPATDSRIVASYNDTLLPRIVKSEDNAAVKKRKSKAITFRQHLPGPTRDKKESDVVSPPPLSKYKKPPPVVPHQPGDRYPLGIPYSPPPLFL